MDDQFRPSSNTIEDAIDPFGVANVQLDILEILKA